MPKTATLSRPKVVKGIIKKRTVVKPKPPKIEAATPVDVISILKGRMESMSTEQLLEMAKLEQATMAKNATPAINQSPITPITTPAEEKAANAVDTADLGRGHATIMKDQGQVVEKNGDVTAMSVTEPLSRRGTEKVVALAAEVQDRWQRREALESTFVYHCPICPSNQRQNFATEPEATTHIESVHPFQVAAFKRQNAQPKMYTPTMEIVSPKRVYSDLVPIAQAQAMAQHNANIAKMTPMQAKGQNSDDGQLRANQVVHLPEMYAVERAEQLSDDELRKLIVIAENGGKENLMKAARTMLKARGVTQ